MSGPDTPGWLPDDPRLRAMVRVALFAGLFLAFLITGAFLAPWLLGVSLPGAEEMPGGLLGQGVLMLAAALLAGWAMLALVDRRPASALGFPLHRRVPLELTAGLALGAGGLAIVVVLLSLAGVFRFPADSGGSGEWLMVAGLSLLGFAIPAAAEEALFRGYAFRVLVEGAGGLTAVLVTSVLFALAHGSNPEVSLLALVNIFLAGILLGVAMLRTGSLWFATSVHLGWNWAMAGPLDLPVSGLDPYDAPLYDGVPGTPAWLSGGAFGPEGGLAGTAAAIAVLALIVRVTRPGAMLAPVESTGEV